MNRCWPLSTTEPVSGSRKEKARPPRCGFFSRTATLSPRSASAAAQESPAKPPPRISASKSMAEQPGPSRQARLAPGGQPHARAEEDREPLGADLLEQALVDARHHLGGQQRRPVAKVNDVARALVRGA